MRGDEEVANDLAVTVVSVIGWGMTFLVGVLIVVAAAPKRRKK